MEKLSKKDLTGVLIVLMTLKLLLVFPRKLVIISGNAAWITAIFTSAVMLVLFYAMTKLYDFKDSLIKTAEKSFGKWFSFAVGHIVIIMLLLSMSSSLRIFPETVKMVLLTDTPTDIILFIAAAAAVLGVYTGIESIGKVTSLFLPVFGLIFIICLLLLLPDMEIKNLMPVLGNGTKSIFFDGLSGLSAFSDIVLIFVLGTPGDRKKTVKSGFTAIAVSGTVLTVLLFVYCIIFPYPASENFLMPMYQLTRLIDIGDFFSRFEAFFEFVWTIFAFIYFSIYLYAICRIWQDIYGLKYHKILAAPFAVVASSAALWPDSYLEFTKNYTWYTMIMVFVSTLAPIAVGAAAHFRRENK